MKKSKKKLTKKQKVIIFFIICVFIFLALLISSLLTKDVKDVGYIGSSVSIKEIVEKNGCTYISDDKSSIKDFDIDIYLQFGKDTIVNGKSMKAYYESIFSSIVYETGYKNLRLIDDSRGLEVKIICSDDNYISRILINDKEDYFKNLLSENSKKQPMNIKVTDMNINSLELQNLVNNSWITSKVSFGSKDAMYNKYDIYFDEGIEVRTISKRIYNIVFTEKYQKEVIGGIKVGADLKQIKERFGTSYDNGSLIGYKTNNFYVFFSNDQISIYPNYNYTASTYTEFENLVSVYSKNKDINDFMDKLTDLWKDYDLYNYDKNYLDIKYTLKGVRISFSADSKNGVQIYENYNGNFKNNQNSSDEIFYKLDESILLESELERNVIEKTIPDDSNEEELRVSKLFLVEFETLDDTRKNKIRIKSKTKEYTNNELDDTIIISEYIWLDDTHLLYSVKGKGIYIYNAITRKTRTLIEGNDETYNVTDYDRESKVLKYDDKRVVIRF